MSDDKSLRQFPPRLYADFASIDDEGSIYVSLHQDNCCTEYLSVAEHEAIVAEMVDIAQGLHEKWLQETGVRVYSGVTTGKAAWTTYQDQPDTHRAILVCQEEIEKEKCKHKSVTEFDGRFFCRSCEQLIKPTGWIEA